MSTKTTGHDLFGLLGSAVLNTLLSVPVAASVLVWLLYGWVWGVVVVGVSIAGMVAWRVWSPGTFERWVTSRARTRLLGWWRYRLCWNSRMRACHLSITRDDRLFIPPLKAVRIGSGADRLRVRMLDGQCPADYENRVDSLAHTFRVLECRATIVGPGLVELVMRHHDSRADVVVLPRQDGHRRKDAA
ncbi:hypothetical protein ACWDYH_29690 [Nocardia goodfellowii]